MTDKPTATSLTEEADATQLWRVDGSPASVTGDDRGLDDTVVRLQPIRDDDFGVAPSVAPVPSAPEEDWTEAADSLGEESGDSLAGEADSPSEKADSPAEEQDSPAEEQDSLAEEGEGSLVEQVEGSLAEEEAAPFAGESEGFPPEQMAGSLTEEVEFSPAGGPAPEPDSMFAPEADRVFAPQPWVEAPVQQPVTEPLPPMGAPLPPPVASSPAAPVVPPLAAAPPVAKAPTRRTRKARLRVSRVDPWSVMKTTFLFSIAAGIMVWVATYVTWSVIEASGLFSVINDQIVNLISSPNDASPWRIEDYLSANKVLGVTALVAVINVVLLTALGTLFAFLYNLSANILGGLELTLAED
ncbi:MAG: DUF3566 domain-containing protein [Propionicimonas sp.]